MSAHLWVSTGVAARTLGVSASTVRNWLESGVLWGTRGPQPDRPRWRVHVDGQGNPLAPDGTPVLEDRKGAARAAVAPPANDGQLTEDELRTLALGLRSAVDRQRRALDLQAAATSELNAALAELADLVGERVVGDPLAAIQGGLPEER